MIALCNEHFCKNLFKSELVDTVFKKFYRGEDMQFKRVYRTFIPIFLLIIAFGILGGCDNKNNVGDGIKRVIVIDTKDDSCVPIDPFEFQNCAEACEVNPLGCANDILRHIESDGFISRRELNPGTIEQKPNIQTPAHGLFVPTWNNPQLNEAINAALENPFAPVDMPDWSISAKYNNNPGITFNTDPRKLDWVTVMYKIPGYCPERIFPDDPNAACKGGEWFWFIYRGGFLAFDYNLQNDTADPAWGKAEAFCLDCHGAAADTDWLWITHDLIRRQQELADPVSTDGHIPAMDGAEFCDDVTELSPIQPPDVRFSPTVINNPSQENRMFNCYGWKTFISLFWPNLEDERGVPDTEKSITASGPRVWETFKQTYEVFQPGDPDWTLDNKNWNDNQPLPQVCIDALEDSNIDSDGLMTFQVLNETHQAFGSQFNNLIDQNNNIVHYNVRINRDEFEFIKENGYADTGTYDYNGPLGINKRLFRFPDNTVGYTGKGSTEVKSAWKILCKDEGCHPLDDPADYFTRTALIYSPSVTKEINPFEQNGELPRPTVTTSATCELKEVGLVGFHIAVKTFWAPQWIWTTFEHIYNVPGNTTENEPLPEQFSFFNPICGNVTPEMCLEQRPGILGPAFEKNPLLICCANQQNILNARLDPGNMGDFMPPLVPLTDLPIQVTRLDAVGGGNNEQSVGEFNQLFRGLLTDEGSVLKNYVMVNTQWPVNGRRDKDADVPFGISNKLCLDGDTNADCVRFIPRDLRLRNSVIETYDMSYCAPEDEDIGNDPADCTPQMVVDDPKQHSSGGCMNCHFNSGTDSSFIWADGIEEQVPLN